MLCRRAYNQCHQDDTSIHLLPWKNTDSSNSCWSRGSHTLASTTGSWTQSYTCLLTEQFHMDGNSERILSPLASILHQTWPRTRPPRRGRPSKHLGRSGWRPNQDTKGVDSGVNLRGIWALPSASAHRPRRPQHLCSNTFLTNKVDEGVCWWGFGTSP